jgi:GNAT superfamily N-acetyltransferase
MASDGTGLEIYKAQKSDLPEILELQKSAFYTEAVFYNNFSIQPMVQTIEDIGDEFKFKLFLKAVIGEQIVASVRAAMIDKKTCFIEKLVVLQEFRDKGIGYKLLTRIQTHFPTAKRFELATGKLSAKNIHIYEKDGFKIYREERISKIPMVFMEKC